MKKILKIATIAAAFAPLMVLAANPGGIAPVTQSPYNLQQLIDTVTNWATGLLVAISVLFVIYAAFIYITTSGDPKGVEQAKNIIIYSVVAVVVALVANVVKSIALGLVGK